MPILISPHRFSKQDLSKPQNQQQSLKPYQGRLITHRTSLHQQPTDLMTSPKTLQFLKDSISLLLFTLMRIPK